MSTHPILPKIHKKTKKKKNEPGPGRDACEVQLLALSDGAVNDQTATQAAAAAAAGALRANFQIEAQAVSQ